MHDKAVENHQTTTNAQSEQTKSMSQTINLELNTTADAIAALSLKDENVQNPVPKGIDNL